MKKKKKDLRYLRWLRNKQCKIEKRSRNRKKRKLNKKISLETGAKLTNDKMRIVFPERIDLYDSKRCKETLDFFNREYDDVDKYKRGVIFNFSKVKTITLSGGIILRCFYDFLVSKHIRIEFDGIERGQIDHVLYHIGILKKENITVTRKDILRWTVKCWNRKETTKKRFGTEIISEIIKTTTGWGEQSEEHKRMYEVIPEVLFNCIQHAYNDDDSFQLFYLFSGIVDNRYVFCIFDKGMGFKATYEKYRRSELEINAIHNDGDYIKYSIQMGSSSIKKLGRGNGLYTLKENITNLGGQIFIHSYKGKVAILPKDKKDKEIQSENRYTLIGSLVQFDVPMTKF